MIIATMETRNFSFIAAGNTKVEAIEAMRIGWLEHVKQYKIPNPYRWKEDLLDGGSVCLFKLNPGQCLRDEDDDHPLI